MKQIPLTNGKFAIVDDEDYYRLVSYKWVAVNLLADKFYARNQKHGLMSKFLLRTNKNEDLVVDFINGNTLDYRRSNLVKRKSIIRDTKQEVLRKNSQLSFDLKSDFQDKIVESTKNSGIFEKTLYEAKHIDQTGRVFHFGLYENKNEAEEAYKKNIKLLIG